jgi:hypothetical protein
MVAERIVPDISWNEVRDRAVAFSRRWAGTTSESAEKQTFWNEFFGVFGRERRTVASFEVAVRNIREKYNHIDLLWGGVLLVEHKSAGGSLDAAESQAFDYIADLAREQRFDEIPHFVVVSDFARFALYDLEPEEQLDLPLFAGRPVAATTFALADLHQYARRFAFLKGERVVRIDPDDPANERAYGMMAALHDKLETGGFTGHELERFLVRVLFCLFAEDTGIFEPNAFTSFILNHTRDDGSDVGAQLNRLFDLLNTDDAHRQRRLDEDLALFPYVNGSLFAERLGFPDFNRTMRDALLACCHFQWARISPAVFGSLFQKVMDRDRRLRRQIGGHYTSERNILKVVRSLFLDELRNEFEQICRDRSNRRLARLSAFHQKLRSLRFFDPACGCGNFLVIAYREIRRLELDVLLAMRGDRERSQIELDVRQMCRVDVDQFWGIEILEWPARIAEVALWLMDHQMNLEVASAFGQTLRRLPLRTSPHIVNRNALDCNWRAILPATECSFLLGNPPFVGKHYRNAEQAADMVHVLGGFGNIGDLDYVTCWFYRAAEYIQDTRIKVGFVATNSITQGEQVPLVWSLLFSRFHIKIHFAHRTFTWESEAPGRAHVHVVIIGFGAFDISAKQLIDYAADPDRPTEITVGNISPYLTPRPDFPLVVKCQTPLCAVPEMRCGNKPSDGGHLILTTEEAHRLIGREPAAREFIREYIGSDEFINGNARHCLWLKDTDPTAWRRIPAIRERVNEVRAFRLASSASPTRKAAETPAIFFYVSQPSTEYLAFPEVSSERRRYVPIGFLPASVIASNKVYIVAPASPYLFGVLSSAMHMAWVREIGGRLKSDIQYSATMVYNTFPFPPLRGEAAVERCALHVLDVRRTDMDRGATLADLYDRLAMPPPLLEAHADLDRAVDRCYRSQAFSTDRERVDYLFTLYEQLASPLAPPRQPAQRRRRQRQPSLRRTRSR